MEQVVSSIRRVTDIMAEITAASQEQTGGIEQVNQAIGQMDQVTQQNAALVEEAAAAAASMQDQAATLAQVVGVFKLDRAHDVALPAHQASRPAIKTAAATPARIAARPAAAARKDKFANKTMSKPVAAGAGDWEEF
jgi:methyl-accepting chemotaxis protein